MILAAVRILIAIATGVGLRYVRPWESPTERAYRLCGEFGVTSDEVDWLIDANKNSALTREQSLELFDARTGGSGA